jgi:hypothetical protein
LRQTLFATDSLVLAAPAFYLAHAEAAFDESGNLRDEQVRTALAGMLDFLVTVLANDKVTELSALNADVAPPR